MGFPANTVTVFCAITKFMRGNNIDDFQNSHCIEVIIFELMIMMDIMDIIQRVAIMNIVTNADN